MFNCIRNPDIKKSIKTVSYKVTLKLKSFEVYFQQRIRWVTDVMHETRQSIYIKRRFAVHRKFINVIMLLMVLAFFRLRHNVTLFPRGRVDDL